MKLQSAMEYLTTYGWAILIIGLVLAVLFGLVSQSAQGPAQQCILPAGFSCINYYMSQNGMLVLNLLQSTQDPVQVTAVGCNNPESVSYMAYPSSQPYFSVPVNMPIGSNSTFYIQCYSNSSAYFGNIGGIYSGYVIINYTNAYTEFPNTIYGKLVVKVTQ